MGGRAWSIAAAVSVFAASAIVGTQFASGAGESADSVFVSITPCRLLDTRPNTPANPDINVGPRDRTIGADETVTFGAFLGNDANSPCEIPVTATAIATNTVAIAPTARSFLTLYPAGVDNPGTANLNFVAGQAPTPNSANVPLSAAGEFNVFNAFGEVHIVVDVNGYFQPSDDVGAKGPQGDKGPDGPDGTDGAAGPDGAPGMLNRLTPEQIENERWDLDPAKPATILVDPTPVNMVSDGRYIYVAHQVQAGSITVIDPDDNSVVTTIDVAGFPNDLLYHDGTVFVALGDPAGNTDDTAQPPGTVITIDTATIAIVGDPIPVGPIPRGMVEFDGRLYVANAAEDNANDNAPDTLSVIDIATRTAFVTRITVGDKPYFIARSADKIFVANQGDDDPSVESNDSVFAFEPNDDLSLISSTSIQVGDAPTSIVYGAGFIWVANIEDHTVSQIDTENEFEIDTISLGINSFPFDIVFDGRYLYTANAGTDDVSVIDPSTVEEIGRIPVGDQPFGLVFDGTNIWVSNVVDGTVQRLLPR